MLTPKSIECQVSHQARERDGLKSSLGLMRRLLLDAQTKYRRVVEENKKLTTKINEQQTIKVSVAVWFVEEMIFKPYLRQVVLVTFF